GRLPDYIMVIRIRPATEVVTQVGPSDFLHLRHTSTRPVGTACESTATGIRSTHRRPLISCRPRRRSWLAHTGIFDRWGTFMGVRGGIRRFYTGASPREAQHGTH